MFRVIALRRSESIRSDKGLTLEMSAFESLYGGQFTLSTQLIKPNYPTKKDECLSLDHQLKSLDANNTQQNKH